MESFEIWYTIPEGGQYAEQATDCWICGWHFYLTEKGTLVVEHPKRKKG